MLKSILNALKILAFYSLACKTNLITLVRRWDYSGSFQKVLLSLVFRIHLDNKKLKVSGTTLHELRKRRETRSTLSADYVDKQVKTLR